MQSERDCNGQSPMPNKKELNPINLYVMSTKLTIKIWKIKLTIEISI